MIRLRVFFFLFLAAVLSSPLEQNLAGLSSPSSLVRPVNLLARTDSTVCNGTPEINAEVKKALDDVSDLMTAIQSATDDNVKSIDNNLIAAEMVATSIAKRPDFAMDAQGQQFVYDWIFKWADILTSSVDNAPVPFSKAKTVSSAAMSVAIYYVTMGFFRNGFGQCLGCDYVYEMNLKLVSIKCDLDYQGKRTGTNFWTPVPNLQCNDNRRLPGCNAISSSSVLKPTVSSTSVPLSDASNSYGPLTATLTQSPSAAISTSSAVGSSPVSSSSVIFSTSSVIGSSPVSSTSTLQPSASGDSSACGGTPELNAEVQKAFNALSDLLTSAQSATDPDAAQQISDDVAVAKKVVNAFAKRPNFEMDAEGQRFVYDWIFEWATSDASFMDQTPKSIPKLQKIIWGCIEISVYEVTQSYFGVKDFGKCLGCDNVHEMNLRIASLRCDLQRQSIRTGRGVFLPFLNLQCGAETLPSCNPTSYSSVLKPTASSTSVSSSSSSSSEVPSTAPGTSSSSVIVSVVSHSETSAEAQHSASYVMSTSSDINIETNAPLQPSASDRLPLSSNLNSQSLATPEASVSSMISGLPTLGHHSFVRPMFSLDNKLTASSDANAQSSILQQQSASSLSHASSDVHTQSLTTVGPTTSTVIFSPSNENTPSSTPQASASGKPLVSSSMSRPSFVAPVFPLSKVIPKLTDIGSESSTTSQNSASLTESSASGENTQSSATLQPPPSGENSKSLATPRTSSSSMDSESLSAGEPSPIAPLLSVGKKYPMTSDVGSESSSSPRPTDSERPTASSDVMAQSSAKESLRSPSGHVQTQTTGLADRTISIIEGVSSSSQAIEVSSSSIAGAGTTTCKTSANEGPSQTAPLESSDEATPTTRLEMASSVESAVVGVSSLLPESVSCIKSGPLKAKSTGPGEVPVATSTEPAAHSSVNPAGSIGVQESPKVSTGPTEANTATVPAISGFMIMLGFVFALQ